MLQSTIFEEIDPNNKKGVTIFHGLKSAVSAIAVHPKRTILAIAGYEKFILLWDYAKRGEPPILNNYELFRKEESKEKDAKQHYFTVMAFTPEGDELLIGQSNGIIQILDTNTGMYKKLTQPLKTSENSVHPVTGLIISNDG